MTDSEIVNFLEELSARTYKSQRYPTKENPSGVHVCALNADIHIGGNHATVYIRGDSCNTLASGHGETFREALQSARDDYNADGYAGECATCGGPVFHREGKPGEYDHECRQHNSQEHRQGTTRGDSDGCDVSAEGEG